MFHCVSTCLYVQDPAMHCSSFRARLPGIHLRLSATIAMALPQDSRYESPNHPTLMPAAPASCCLSNSGGLVFKACLGSCLELCFRCNWLYVLCWLNTAYDIQDPGYYCSAVTHAVCPPVAGNLQVEGERSSHNDAGPPPVWLIGNLLDVLRLSFPKAAQHWRKQYGPVFKVSLKCSPIIDMDLARRAEGRFATGH